jgi:guanylate kinase
LESNFIEMNKTNINKGQIVIVSGPSGVGKSTICKMIVERMENACLSVSVTTRPKSKIEENGKDYCFITKQEFQERIDKGLLLEYANVFGNMYGTPKDKVDEILEKGKTIILEIDIQGARQVKEIYPDAIMIFILPPSSKVLSLRISGRGRDSSDSIELRMKKANTEIAAARKFYENLVVNEDLQQAVDDCVQIIKQSKNDDLKSKKR